MDHGDLLVNAIKSCANFPIDVELEGYPDVLFDIVFNDFSYKLYIKSKNIF